MKSIFTFEAEPFETYSEFEEQSPATTPRVLTYSTKDVIDKRISVPAQHSLVRLSKNSATSADAGGMLEAVKLGQLAGIYCVNWEKAAQRSLKLGKNWWTVIPQGVDAVLMLDPDNLSSGPPLIAFRRDLDPECGLMKGEKRFAASPSRLDAVLLRMWNTYLNFRQGKIVPCLLSPDTAKQPSGEPTVPETCRAASVPPPLCPCPPTTSPDWTAWLQKSLNQIFGIRLPVNGVFDVQTRSGLRNFQRRNRIAPTETIDPTIVSILLRGGASRPPCRIQPCPAKPCSLFVPPNPRGDYFHYVASPTTGKITPLINGRNSGGPGPNRDKYEAFRAMEDVVAALTDKDFIYLAAWIFDPSTQLVTRNGTWGQLLRDKARAGVKIRIILTDFDPLYGMRNVLYQTTIPQLNSLIGQLQNKAENLKYIVSPHPAVKTLKTFRFSKDFLLGAHHQKFMVVSRNSKITAFCGGLDIEGLRIPPSWSPQNKLWWHDIHTKLDGLIALDLEAEFARRWNQEKDRSSTDLQPGWNLLERLVPSIPDSSQIERNLNQHKIQMIRTVSAGGSKIPNTTRDDIWQAYLRMIKCARRFIYIENQYLREPRLADVMSNHVNSLAGQNVIIIIVVSSELEEADPFSKHGETLQYEFFSRLTSEVPADRLRFYTMFHRMVHSKFILVDDRAMSIGSANANPRGFQLDTELNVIIDARDIVRRFRQRLWAHNLGVDEAKVVATWRHQDFMPAWDRIAAANNKLLSQKNAADAMTGEGIVPFDYTARPGIALTKEWQTFLREIDVDPNVLSEVGTEK